MNSSSCPHCKSIITSVKTEDVTLTVGVGKPAWKGFSHACTTCNTVLSIEVNPLTIQGEILDALGRLRR